MGPRRRALILLAIVLDVPVLARAVRRLTLEPQVERRELEGVPSEIVRPGGNGPWPAWVFVNGAHPLRRNEPVVERLSRGLARAGYLVVVPDLPGLGEGRITTRTLEATAAVTRAASELPDTRGGRVAVIGVSTGGALALVVAGRPDLAERISLVASVAPFADLEKMICLATTGRYEEGGEFVAYTTSDLLRRIVARSLVASLSAGADQDRLLAELDRMEAEDADPVERLPALASGVAEEARAVLRLLGNRDPRRFRELFDALPRDVHALVDTLSPLAVGARVRAPVEVVVPPTDQYFPLGEAQALAEAFPTVRLTVTKTLDHTRPTLSVRHVGDFIRFDRFVIRGLARSAS